MKASLDRSRSLWRCDKEIHLTNMALPLEIVHCAAVSCDQLVMRSENGLERQYYKYYQRPQLLYFRVRYGPSCCAVSAGLVEKTSEHRGDSKKVSPLYLIKIKIRPSFIFLCRSLTRAFMTNQMFRPSEFSTTHGTSISECAGYCSLCHDHRTAIRNRATASTELQVCRDWNEVIQGI
jgi:hypothetical protein